LVIAGSTQQHIVAAISLEQIVPVTAIEEILAPVEFRKRDRSAGISRHLVTKKFVCAGTTQQDVIAEVSQ